MPARCFGGAAWMIFVRLGWCFDSVGAVKAKLSDAAANLEHLKRVTTG